MPRNRERNLYVTIGFGLHSQTLMHLQEEALHLGKQLPAYIKELLADRDLALHEGESGGYWFPRGYQFVAPPYAAHAKPEHTLEVSEEMRRANAKQAASAWSEDDE